MEIRVLLSTGPDGGGNYRRALSRAGGSPAGGYCPAEEDGCWGLVLCGGGDMDPARFGQADRGSRGVDPRRDGAELELARRFLAAGKPVLGICRGHQVLNVLLGGTLLQDIGPELGARHTQGEDLRDKVHLVHGPQGSFFTQIFGGESFPVNSAHHQALDRLGEGLVPCLFSEEGLVEGMVHAARPLLSVQFHPERMPPPWDPAATAAGSPLLERFIALCREVSHGR